MPRRPRVEPTDTPADAARIDDTRLTIDAGELSRALRCTRAVIPSAKTIAKEYPKYDGLQDVLIETAGDVCYIVGTDSHRLVVCAIPRGPAARWRWDVRRDIPQAACEALLSACAASPVGAIDVLDVRVPRIWRMPSVQECRASVIPAVSAKSSLGRAVRVDASYFADIGKFAKILDVENVVVSAGPEDADHFGVIERQIVCAFYCEKKYAGRAFLVQAPMRLIDGELSLSEIFWPFWAERPTVTRATVEVPRR